MYKTEIVSKLKPLIERPEVCGFEAFLVSRTEPRLKKLKLSIVDLQQNLKRDITAVIKERYLAEDAIYTEADNIADNQVKFYIVKQNDEYKPFDVGTWEEEEFTEEQLNDFMGFFFHFRYDKQNVWCYQNRRSTTVTNRKKSNVLARLKHYDSGWVFEEQNEKIVNFAHVIDILVLDGNLITSDVGLLERSFNFQLFIYQKAKEAAEKVAETKLFGGMDKLNEYLSSDAKSHKTYKKKMMKALDSPVLKMTSDALIEKVTTLPRWKGKFRDPVDGTIPIDSVKEIEAMIDLLSERFTVSPVTGQEYDTEVKKKAEEIEPRELDKS